MKIDFDYEVSELTRYLKSADGYLDCEKIVLANTKRQLYNRIAIHTIESYLKELQKYFEDKSVVNKGNEESVNYKYAAGFLNTINNTPYWHSWGKTTD